MPPKSSSPQPTRHWSLAKRFLWISIGIVLAESVASMIITRELRQHFLKDYLQAKMSRQILAPLREVNNQLDRLSGPESQRCCTLQDYRNFLKPLELYDGKIGIILGSAGLASTRGSRVLYSDHQLRTFAEKAVAAPDGYVELPTGLNEAVAGKAVKLSGGAQTGSFIYLRPVYSKPLIQVQMLIKLLSELALIAVTAGILIIAARRLIKPLNSITEDLAQVELNSLDGATLATENAPTELLPILEEFNRMVERLRNSAANQKQFASTISHEFRTPLTVISGFLQSVLNRSETLTEQQRQALGIADQETLRLNRMLSDLLDLSRADNQQLSIRRESFQLRPSLDHVLRLARSAHDNAINDNLATLPELTVIGDSDRLVQCLGNLIGNAVKYAKSGSPISLMVVHTPASVRLTVRDQGQGIPADQLDRIFERFTRAEGVVLPKGQSSSGLGLSIVKMLMEAMGGTVSVQSTVGQGSAFTLELPLADQP